MKVRTKRVLLAGGLTLAVSLWVVSQSARAADPGGPGGQDGAEGSSGEAVREHGRAGGEGKIELSAETMVRLGVKVLVAGPARLNVSVPLTGKLFPHEDRVSHVTPRFPGVIREVRKRLGDPVRAGETLAVVENNQSLQPYEVKSQLPGIVVTRHAVVGEAVTDASPLFDVADYSELFADFYVFPGNFGRVRLGQRVLIRFPGEPGAVESSISFLSPVTDPVTQSRFVRAVLPNPAAAYQAGMFVTGDVVLEEVTVPVAVAVTAVRTSGGKAVVFVEEGEGRFQARPVLVGRTDKDRAEILQGLTAGERYAAGNTFILLAELEKSEAEQED